MTKKTPKPCPPDFKPTERDYALLDNRGIPREYAGHQIHEFREYWTIGDGAGVERADWNRAFRNRVEQKWDWDRHKFARRNEKPCKALELEPFELVAKNAIAPQSRPQAPEPRYKAPAPDVRKPGKPASTETALAALREMRSGTIG